MNATKVLKGEGKTRGRVWTYVISIAIALGVGGLSALLTMGNMNLYSDLKQPPLARAVIKVPYISLVNLLANKPLVNELIQNDANAAACAQITNELFSHPQKLAAMHEELLKLRASLGEPGVAKRAAADILGDL